jgi:hypothetical protein
LSISNLQFPSAASLSASLKILGCINRVSNDRNHVQIEIFHVERHIPAAMTARGDEPALKGKGSERFRKRDRIADIVQHNIDPGPIGDAPRLGCQVLTR